MPRCRLASTTIGPTSTPLVGGVTDTGLLVGGGLPVVAGAAAESIQPLWGIGGALHTPNATATASTRPTVILNVFE